MDGLPPHFVEKEDDGKKTLSPDFPTKVIAAVVLLLTLGSVGWVGTSVLSLTSSTVELRGDIRALQSVTTLRMESIEREMRENQRRREEQIKELKDQMKELAAAVRGK